MFRFTLSTMTRPAIALGLSATVLFGCAAATSTAPEVEATADDVVEIAIRRLNDGQDVAAFEAARDAFVKRLREQTGVGTDREFSAFFDYGAGAPPSPAVFIGMTQYDSIDAYKAAGQALGQSAEAGAFFSTFKPALFTVLRPLHEGGKVDLAAIASAQGQVVEVAYRNLSSYSNFDQAAYAAARDKFLALLTAQAGVVAEYQWVSVLDPNIVVGMTVYKDQAAFQKLASDPAVVQSPEATAFLSSYPPAGGFMNAVVR